MNILVTGANGQLGHEMQKCAKNSKHKFVFTDVAEGNEKLDITNFDTVRAKEYKTNILISLVALALFRMGSRLPTVVYVGI